MSNLKLGINEKYDIEEEIIVKYNIKPGTVSPCTRLLVIDINEQNNGSGIDIRIPSTNSGVDIKIPSSYSGVDIKIPSDDSIDIKIPSTDNDIDIKIPSK